ncbi:hypothetical protein Ate02nite_30890 [Paractinoplanes tereljensis]|uniref:Uncharacterized protein n=1 Tax=Paractinoplanes tereljensis TaxID=571912 RepID=A0A919TSL3_9ACTN|nr:hypothetical protein Ate02nite_30890 [Actinoplanes tereljensis]
MVGFAGRFGWASAAGAANRLKAATATVATASFDLYLRITSSS